MLTAGPAMAEDGLWSPDSYRSGGSGASSSPRGGSYSSSGADTYSSNRGGYGSSDSYAPRRDSYSANGDTYSSNQGGYGGDTYSPRNDAYSTRGESYSGGRDAYAPPHRGDSYGDPGRPVDDGGRGGYGEPYAPPGQEAYREPPAAADEDRSSYSQNEIIAAGHGFFGAISQGLAKAVEYAFQSQGRPNGYILGEDAGGAFIVGLRYGEGRLYTKDAGDHKVFWQGPSLGYDAGAEGSKTMVLVYNLSDPSEIYQRFGGVQGSAYLVGGLSVQFQKYGEVTLAVIRTGVGVRLGANVGYLKYTRTPTWNPL